MEKYALRNTLKFHRAKLGITQKELAELLNLNKSYYSRLENGSIIPNIKICLMIRDSIQKIYTRRTGKHLDKITVDRLFMLEPFNDEESN